jgi:hypothetical protein
MKRYAVVAALVLLHLVVFEALIRWLHLREFGYRIMPRDILLLLCVPFAVPTIPALLETRLVSLAIGEKHRERLEQGVYPVDVAAGLVGVVLAGIVLVVVDEASLLWALLGVLMLVVIGFSGWVKYGFLRQVMGRRVKKSLGAAVFGGNMLACGLFLGAWFVLLTQKLLS